MADVNIKHIDVGASLTKTEWEAVSTHAISIPVAAGDAIRATAKITEVLLESATDLKHTAGTDTALGAVGTKNPPVDADLAIYRDSVASFVLVTSTWTQVKAFLKTYFDTLYNLYVHPNHSGAVTSVADGAQTITDEAVTYAKMQHVSAIDKVLGRATAGAGDVEEIACTAAGRALLDDAAASDQRTTLGLGTMAVATAADYQPLQMAENLPLLLDAALSADGKYSGICEAGTAGTALAFGNLCYLAVADSRWELADANTLALANAKLGICVLAAADTAATTLLLYGKVNAASLYPALTIGAKVYVGETAGNIQVAAPTADTDIIRVIGFANTADEIFFCPDSGTEVALDDTSGGNDGAIYKAATANALYDSIVAHAALTETHGATGAVVGTTNTQTLTLKTFQNCFIDDVDATPVGDVMLTVVDGVLKVRNAANNANANMTCAQIDVGDIKFANDWVMTEDEKYGVVLVSPKGKKFRMMEC